MARLRTGAAAEPGLDALKGFVELPDREASPFFGDRAVEIALVERTLNRIRKRVLERDRRPDGSETILFQGAPSAGKKRIAGAFRAGMAKRRARRARGGRHGIDSFCQRTHACAPCCRCGRPGDCSAVSTLRNDTFHSTHRRKRRNSRSCFWIGTPSHKRSRRAVANRRPRSAVGVGTIRSSDSRRGAGSGWTRDGQSAARHFAASQG